MRRASERRRNDLATIGRHWELRRAQVAALPAALRRDAARADVALKRVSVEALRRRKAAAAKVLHVFAAVNYKSILGRGFALVLDGKGAVLTNVAAAEAARLLTIRFGDGDVAAEAKRPRPRRAGKRPPPNSRRCSELFSGDRIARRGARPMQGPAQPGGEEGGDPAVERGVVLEPSLNVLLS